MQIDSFNEARYERTANGAARLLGLVLIMCLLYAPANVIAVEMTALYTVEVSLDPDDPDATENAYRAALNEVLVRITGTTAAAVSPELTAIFPNPASYVLQYRSAPDNALIVSLDGPAILRMLRQFGATIWDSDRPLTLILIGVDWGQGDREIVAAEGAARAPGDIRFIDRNRVLRERVQKVADFRGLPVTFPLLDSEDLQAMSFTDIWGGFDDQLLASAARYGADSVLVGRIRPDSMLEHRWTWYHLGQRRDWSGDASLAINMLGDSLANQYAVGGDTAIDTIRLTISVTSSVLAYGEIQNYMENLRGIDKLAVKSASADSITYEVTVQGGAERLGRALELSGLLDRVTSTSAPFDSGETRRENDPFATDNDSMGETQVLEYLYRSD